VQENPVSFSYFRRGGINVWSEGQDLAQWASCGEEERASHNTGAEIVSKVTWEAEENRTDICCPSPASVFHSN
jgi:hypothetical protein